jgi:hypothetical protein
MLGVAVRLQRWRPISPAVLLLSHCHAWALHQRLGAERAISNAVTIPQPKKPHFTPTKKSKKLEAKLALGRKPRTVGPLPVHRTANPASDAPKQTSEGSKASATAKQEDSYDSFVDEHTVIATQAAAFKQILRGIHDASTDAELWKHLEEGLFIRLKQLDPDSLSGDRLSLGAARKQRSSTKMRRLELRELQSNYAPVIVTAIRQLRDRFPSSTLALAILPVVKSLGRWSYTVGASTELYNEHMAAVWNAYADFRQIDELLHDMDNNGHEFDSDTLGLVESIQREREYGISGQDGEVSRLIWDTALVQSGWQKLADWPSVIKERLAEAARRKADEDKFQEDADV